MVNINWCLKQKSGLRLIEANENLSESYIKMAEDSLGTMNRERNYNLVFAISACYYSMYYSLYAVLMRIGVKCEIHQCTIEFMKNCLASSYEEKDVRLIMKAFDLRNTAQYYADKVLDEKETDFIIENALSFFEKSRGVLMKMNEHEINTIRKLFSAEAGKR